MFEKVGKREAVRLKEEIVKMIEEIKNEKLLGQIYSYIKYLMRKASTEK